MMQRVEVDGAPVSDHRPDDNTIVDANLNPCVGGKAAALLKLQAAGFRVPAFVVSPDDVAATIDQLGFPLAVRSSATVEDGEEASFAGQFRSFLNLETEIEVKQAIAACHASVHDPEVRRYCLKHNVPLDKLRMEVIVQRMVAPELAGVAFTVNPVSGDEEITIEAVAGLSDDLLSGRAAALSGDDPVLQKHRPEIARVAHQIQRYFGTPQDIEFAVENDRLWILQARPITRIGFAKQRGQWTTADFRDGGVSSTVCTPLMWSLYELAWAHALKGTLRELKLFQRDFTTGKMFFGRPYWNLAAVKAALAKLPGFDEREFDRDLSVQVDEDHPAAVTSITPRTVLQSIPTLLAVRRFLKQQRGAAESLLLQTWHPPARETLQDLIHGDFFQVEQTYFRTIFAASLAKMDFCSSFPDADYGALVAALPPLRHVAPVREVQSLDERSPERLQQIIDRYAHHYRCGLDIVFPRWGDDRQFVAEMLAQLPACGGTDPQPAYVAARAETRGRLAVWKRRRFDRKLDRLRRFLWLREELRDVSNRLYYRIRQHVMQLGAERGLGDSIFFQTFQEILADCRTNIEPNRERYESFRHFAAPNEIGSGFHFEAHTATGAMSGIGASPGSTTAFAFVARSVEQAVKMPRGCILVCPYTDPGWTAVLDRAAGVVTETGGLLSHAAILCREYGIPAILNVPDATKRIVTNQCLTIDGGAGQIETLPLPMKEDQ